MKIVRPGIDSGLARSNRVVVVMAMVAMMMRRGKRRSGENQDEQHSS